VTSGARRGSLVRPIVPGTGALTAISRRSLTGLARFGTGSPLALQALERNRAQVLSRIEDACRAAGRDAGDVRLLCVTKQVAPKTAAGLVALGSPDLGENRVAELERKSTWFRERDLVARWHFIGHLQRNKARRVFELADEIHSVDSARLLETLLGLAAESERRPGIYLQVKVADEDAKGGILPDELPGLVHGAAAAGTLPLLGLMTMAPLIPDAEESRRAARAAFERLAALARSLPAEAFSSGAPQLSMGMSADFVEAIAAGSQVVRIGSALYHEDPSERRERV